MYIKELHEQKKPDLFPKKEYNVVQFHLYKTLKNAN